MRTSRKNITFRFQLWKSWFRYEIHYCLFRGWIVATRQPDDFMSIFSVSAKANTLNLFVFVRSTCFGHISSALDNKRMEHVYLDKCEKYYSYKISSIEKYLLFNIYCYDRKIAPRVIPPKHALLYKNYVQFCLYNIIKVADISSIPIIRYDWHEAFFGSYVFARQYLHNCVWNLWKYALLAWSMP